MGERQIPGLLKGRYRQLPGDARKIIKKNHPRSLQPIVSDIQPKPTVMYPMKVTNARNKPQISDTAISFIRLADLR
jgi:hypothetical protein